jgi:hypothetical protein
MFKFLISDLPVLLNVDVGTYQLMLSVYFLPFIVGIAVVIYLERNPKTFVRQITFFFKFIERNSALVAAPTNLNFSLGP